MNALILSAALDTNGQNGRYARASQKWGTADGVLKALAVGKYDPASVIGRYQAAADKSDALVIRSAHRSHHIYQQMPADIFWNRMTEPLIRGLALDADVIHLNNSWRPWQQLRLKVRKPMLLHHHGSLFRSDPKGMLSWAKQWGVTQCVSTVDLTRMAPERLHWAPTAYDVDWLQSFGAEHREHDGIRVVSAPTNREIKSTALLEQAVAKLQADGLNVELLLVEGKPWLEAMAIKATADIYFDQVGLGYGCNAVEAWGMGIPVIAGADEWTLNRMRAMWSNELPFYQATEETIGEAIIALATSKRLRTTWANRGLRHVRRYHDELPALTRLAELYRMTIEQVPYQVDTPIPPSRFTATVQQVHIAGHYVNFPCEIDNPFMATRIRLHGLRYPKYGIVEEQGA